MAETTLPGTSFIAIAVALWFDDKEEVFIILLLALATVDHSCVVTHDS